MQHIALVNRREIMQLDARSLRLSGSGRGQAATTGVRKTSGYLAIVSGRSVVMNSVRKPVAKIIASLRYRLHLF
jgi:hypothetical protein